MKVKLLTAAASLLLLATGCQNTPEPNNGAEAKANNERVGVQAAGDVNAGAPADESATAADTTDLPDAGAGSNKRSAANADSAPSLPAANAGDAVNVPANTDVPANLRVANAGTANRSAADAGDRVNPANAAAVNLPAAGAESANLPAAGAGSVNRSAVQEANAAEDWIPLPWEKVTVDGSIQVLKEGLNQAERIVKTTTLYAIAGSRETKVVIYAKQGDTDHLHAALVRDDVVYDLGPAAGYAYDRDDALTVSNIMLFQKEIVKIQGSVGAAASMTRYIDLTDGTPKLLLAVDEGNASESDVDHDGLPEVVVSAGTIPNTSIYRWKDGQIERVQLNEALQAEAASITIEGAVLGAFGPNQSEIRLYWLKKDGLIPFASYSSENYYSDRYVTIPYTSDELLGIREQADKMRIFDPYVPRKGIVTDYLVDVRIVEDGVMQLTYPHFGIRQSRTDLRPQDLSAFVPGEKLYFPDFTAEWIGLPDSEAGGDWYIQRGSTYLSIGSAKSVSKDELLFVIASLVPLEELKLPDGTVPAANTPPPVTREYLFALQAANEFASAWARRDPENGLKWVTDEWKAGKDPLYLDAVFRGTSNPHHLTFELFGKRRVDERTYLFDLRLHDYYTAQPDSTFGFPADRGRGGTLEVVKQGDTEWGEGVWRVNP